MKREFFGILVAILFVFPAMGSISRASQSSPTSWVPYPWAEELPFTWSTAQGVWVVGTTDEPSYFYIRVTKDRDNKAIKYLAITEKDRATCLTVATGFGTEENEKRIVAEMRSVDTKSRYRMMLRLYNPNGVPRAQDVNVQPFKGKVMVMTIKSSKNRAEISYPLVKVSDRTEFECKPTK